MWDSRKYVIKNDKFFQILDAVDEGIRIYKPLKSGKVRVEFHAEGGYTGGWVWFNVQELIDWLKERK